MKLTNSDYVARISNASPIKLVVITYELILAHVDDAMNSRDDRKEYVRHVELSTELLGTLMDALNMDYELSRTLFPLYVYVNKLLINSKISRTMDYLKDVRDILTPLYKSWVDVAQNEAADQPVMDKSQTIYAGLTYGRGELSEYIKEDEQKSYKA